jgi:PAS domain S-box-containing protein
MTVMVGRYWILKVQARFMSGDYRAGLAAAERAKKLHWSSEAFLQSLDYYYYTALTVAALYKNASADEQEEWRELLTAHREQLRVWAENYPPTFADKHALVSAEIARLEGRPSDAMELYEQAIQSAHENGFAQNEGLGYEIAARFYAARGFETIANAYLRNARSCYLRWGANGKVRQLDQLHPRLADAEGNRPTPTFGSLRELDVASVVKASQAVSSEIELPKLIERLMTIALENAGADRGLLILPVEDDYLIQAEAQAAGEKVAVTLRQKSISGITCPESLIRYVIRTQESVILDDASRSRLFSDDDYLRGRQTKSILCLPLIKQGRLTGLLYFENTLASHAFTPDRVAVLEVLAAQAAISLENTRLYSDLQEREAKVRRLVDSNIIGILILDPEGRILEANEAFLHMVGYSRDDLISGRLSRTALTPNEWSDATERAQVELRATGSCKAFEKEYFRKDGTRVPVLVGGATFGESRDEGVAFVLDLTERKRAEYLTGHVFESSPDSMCIIGKDYRVQRVNPVFERFWRTPAATAVGRHIAEIVGTEYFEREGKPRLDRCFAGEEEVIRADWYPTPRGRRYRVVTYSLLRPDSQRGEAALLVARDFTDYVQASEALRAAQTQLAHANRVTTMGQLTASIAHEVNQPIAATVTNAHAALRWLDTQPPDLHEVRQALDSIIKDGGRAGQVIHRIRALIKKVPPHHDQLDLNDAIRDVIEVTRSELIGNGVSLQTEFAEELPLIRGDRVQLQQIVLNLIMNAVEAMSEGPSGSRDLLISTMEEAPSSVLVAVRDSGPGLKPESLERLFDPFYTTKSGGMGMGLSICRSIVEAHGGRLWAKPSVPQGAAFHFSLPVHGVTAS